MKKITANPSENLQALFDFYQVTAQAEPVEENVIHLDGVIGLDVTADEVEEQLRSFNGKPALIKMSGPGGFIMPGLRIHNLIRDYSGHTEVRIMGYAASMTSYIPMAADKVTAHDNTIFMIHNAQGIAAGDHIVMQKGVDLVRRTSTMLAQAYVAKTGKSEKEIREMMDESSYFFGSEALTAGFVDEIIETGETRDKQTAIAQTNSLVSDCMAKMKASVEAKKDIEQLAAMISELPPMTASKPEPTATIAPAPTAEDHNGLLNISNNQNPAANAGKRTEENNMSLTLKELLAQNPAAKIEHDDAIKNARGLRKRN
jgi:ATP-dependent protease ClpP protease subunit